MVGTVIYPAHGFVIITFSINPLALKVHIAVGFIPPLDAGVTVNIKNR